MSERGRESRVPSGDSASGAFPSRTSSPSPSARKRQHLQVKTEETNLREEKEIILDDICADMRKGLGLGLSKLKKALMSATVEVNDVDEFGCSLLLAACQGGLVEGARDLIERGADVSWVDEHGVSPLHVAMLFEHVAVVSLLLDKGADPDSVTKAGEKPGQLSLGRIIEDTFEACKAADAQKVLTLLGRNWMPVDLREEHASNLDLHKTIIQERKERSDRRPGSRSKSPNQMEPLDEKGASHSATPTTHATSNPCIEQGGRHTHQTAQSTKTADDQASAEGGSTGDSDRPARPTRRTLLMYASAKGMMKVVKALVRMRADITLLDSDGLGAQMIANNAGHLDIAHYLNSKVQEHERVELPAPERDSLSVLRDKFYNFCAMGTSTLGTAVARTGRVGSVGAERTHSAVSRDATMDFAEFQKMLSSLDLLGSDKPLSKSVAAEVFQAVNKAAEESGELHWVDFKDCLFRLGQRLGLEEIESVPLAALRVERAEPSHASRSRALDAVPLCAMSKSLMGRELEWMQRQLQAIADRTKQVTPCSYAAYGHGVTTGNHKLRPQTLNVYRRLLRVPGQTLAVPALDKPKEVRKKEMMAKSFFNTIDKDHSGTLTRYELQWALDDFGFDREEQDEVFRLVDADNSGSVTLHEFIKGMNDGNVNFAGRTSRSRKTQTYLDIGLRLSRSVNQRQNPSKVLAISPGLFGQIFKAYSDFAMSDRLASFEESSCVFRAPALSAVASPAKTVRKSTLGINSRFAVVNPFDPRVLAASSPNASADLAGQEARQRSPGREGSRSPQPSKRRTASLSSSSYHSTPARSEAAPSPEPSRTQTPVQTGKVQYRRQMAALKDTMRRPKSGREVLRESPDGKLISEHTRITLIPHRLTITQSGQLLVGGVTGMQEGKSEASLSQLAVKKHRLTQAGVALLRRVVFRSLSMGAGHCAAVTDTGLVFTWGQGRYGQLGHGDSEDKIVPQPVQGITGEIKIVSAGFYHTLAVTRAGSLYTWGDGKEGKLGHNDDATRLLPTLVSEFLERGMLIKTAQAGGSHTVALSSDLQVYTFGSGASGRLGHGNDKAQWVPLLVSALEMAQVVSLAAGFAHSVALTVEGEVYTWGSGKLGRLGHRSESDEVLPRKVALLSNATVSPLAVAAGEAHTCLFRSDGSMVTLGRLTHGRIAEGSCIQDRFADLRNALAMQSADDWHHFPT